MFGIEVFIFVCLFSSTIAAELTTKEKKAVGCGEQGDCVTSGEDCSKRCGCDRLYFLNETLDECQLDLKYLNETAIEKYNTSEKLRINAEKVFNGIIVAVILFMSCASLCVVTACIYCFRINYQDEKLANDIKALSEKLKRDGKLKKPEKIPTNPVAETCNIVVGDAGVFVV